MEKKIPPLASKQLETLLTPISDITPHPDNYKKHPKDQINALRASLKTFGCTQPIKVNLEGIIVAGHGMYQLYKEEGYTHVPVIYEALDSKLSKAYIIADNETSRKAQTDQEQLISLLDEVLEIPDIDLQSTGFDLDDYNFLQKELEHHNKMYNVGEGATDKHIDFIDDEEKVYELDQEANDIFSGKNTIIVMFSGGKDSTFSLLWALQNFKDKQIYAVFSDTGVEFPGMTAHIWEACNYLNVECVIVKPKIDVWVEWAKTGKFFAKMYPKCQQELIFNPISDFILTFPASDVVILDGSRGDQRRPISKKTKTSGSLDSRLKDYQFYHPAYDIGYDLEESTVLNSGVPMWEGYSMGFKRSACWCCPGQSGIQAYMLQKNYPGLADVIRRWEKKLDMPLDFVKGIGIDHLIEVGRKKIESCSTDIESEE